MRNLCFAADLLKIGQDFWCILSSSGELSCSPAMQNVCIILSRI